MFGITKTDPVTKMRRRHRRYRKNLQMSEIRRVIKGLEMVGFCVDVDPVVARWFGHRGFSYEIRWSTNRPLPYAKVELPDA